MPTPAFDAALNFTVFNPEVEGGLKLSDLAGDAGGLTFAGISRVYWPGWDGWKMLDAGVDPTSDEIIHEVRMFYLRHFWERVEGDKLPQKVAMQMFDMAVNSGVQDAVRCVQRALGNVKVDGALGPKTVAAIREAHPVELAVRFNIARARHYARCKPPLFPGWFNRLALMTEKAMEP